MAQSIEASRGGRVALVVTALMHGGAEGQVAELAIRLARRGWEPEVISMVEPSAHVEALTAAGVPVTSLRMRPSLPDPRAIARLARRLRTTRPDIVHSHMVHANLLARVTRPLAPMPVLISTAHNIREGRRWREIAYRLTDPLCDLVTNVSRAAVERYVDVGAAPSSKIRYLPNGIDVTRFRPDERSRARLRAELGLEDGRPLLLAVGRLAPAKDYMTLIAAFAAVRGEHADAVLAIAGEGPLESMVREQVWALGLGRSVRLLGVRADVPALMNAADVYVMSSRWEGLPLVLLEAAATGLPIVATDVGGNAEVVREGVSGHIVPAGRPDALAHALARVLALTPEERRRMGAAGRALVEESFDIERVVDRWEAIYAELLEARAGGERTPAASTGGHAEDSGAG